MLSVVQAAIPGAELFQNQKFSRRCICKLFFIAITGIRNTVNTTFSCKIHFVFQMRIIFFCLLTCELN